MNTARRRGSVAPRDARRPAHPPQHAAPLRRAGRQLRDAAALGRRRLAHAGGGARRARAARARAGHRPRLGRPGGAPGGAADGPRRARARARRRLRHRRGRLRPRRAGQRRRLGARGARRPGRGGGGERHRAAGPGGGGRHVPTRPARARHRARPLRRRLRRDPRAAGVQPAARGPGARRRRTRRPLARGRRVHARRARARAVRPPRPAPHRPATADGRRAGGGARRTAELLRPPDEPEPVPAAPLREIVRRPGAIPALLAGQASFAVMVGVMTLTGAVVTDHQHHDATAVFPIIGAHVMGMYALVLVIGELIDRVGRTPALAGGLVVMAVSCSSLLWVESVVATAIVLFGLGIGWNLSFVAATATLADCASAAERGKLLGFNDLLAGLTGARLALLGGVALTAIGVGALAIGGATLVILPALWILTRRGLAPALQ